MFGGDSLLVDFSFVWPSAPSCARTHPSLFHPPTGTLLMCAEVRPGPASTNLRPSPRRALAAPLLLVTCRAKAQNSSAGTAERVTPPRHLPMTLTYYRPHPRHARRPQVHLDPALEPSKMTGDETFVFGLHPHGVLSDYRILLDGVTREHFPKVCTCSTRVMPMTVPPVCVYLLCARGAAPTRGARK